MAGISFAAIFVRVALPAPPVVTAFYRMLFAALLIGAWLLATRRSFLGERRAIGAAIASGLCFGVDMSLWNLALVKTSVAAATLLVNTTPVIVGLYALLVLRQPLRGRFVAGTALALAGTAVLVDLGGDARDDLEGAGLALAAALFYAAYLLLMVSARRRADAIPALFWMTVAATCASGLIGVGLGNPFTGFPPSSWAAMLGAALVSQICGVMGVVWALRYLPATLASVALLAQPVGAALLAWVLLGETLGGTQVLGGGVVLAGIALASRAARET